MDNQKEIQNMIEIVEKVFSSNYSGDYESGIRDFATRLIQNNVKILPENSVVLIREEYERLLICEHNLTVGRESYRRLEEMAYASIENLKQEKDQACKETVRKILDEIKFLVEERNGANIEDLSIDGTILEEVLDELAKKYGVE